eukprot:763866-Hanusia_phi.AAC.2
MLFLPWLPPSPDMYQDYFVTIKEAGEQAKKDLEGMLDKIREKLQILDGMEESVAKSIDGDEVFVFSIKFGVVYPRGVTDGPRQAESPPAEVVGCGRKDNGVGQGDRRS